tara:strand:+ start:394 stop:954 length:561 start_codon:yes stop_codon:yes gene_type:complete
MMNRAPERYTDDQVLTTYLETKNITIYCHGPVGIQPFEPFFKNMGTKAMLAFVKPNHWKLITEEYHHHTHILVLRDPLDQHRHGTFLHGMSMHEVSRKRNNMFYSTHLRPHLGTVANAQFDFYIPFEELNKYLFEWQTPEPPAVETGMFFDIREEMEAYNKIKNDKMKLEIPQWRELLMRGQLEEI